MAGAMNKYLFPLLLSGLLGQSGALLAATDPTRPPAAWLSQGPAAEAGADNGGPRLQSVLLPQRGKPVVVIAGTTVVLGGQFGGATLVRVTEREAVLQGPDGVTHLYLTPDVEKQMIVSPRPRHVGKAGHGKDSR